MRDVSVEIITKSGSECASTVCGGVSKESGGKYRIKAQTDDATFFFEYDTESRCLAAHRRGGADYDLRFKSGESYTAALTTPLGRIDTECRTVCAGFEKLADGYSVFAEYTLGGEEYRIKINARYK